MGLSALISIIITSKFINMLCGVHGDVADAVTDTTYDPYGINDAVNSSLDAAENTCLSSMRTTFFIAWACFVLITMPLQYLVITLFKAFRDELTEDSDGYTKVQ